jgi:hypothetical protein
VGFTPPPFVDAAGGDTPIMGDKRKETRAACRFHAAPVCQHPREEKNPHNWEGMGKEIGAACGCHAAPRLKRKEMGGT